MAKMVRLGATCFSLEDVVAFAIENPDSPQRTRLQIWFRSRFEFQPLKGPEAMTIHEKLVRHFKPETWVDPAWAEPAGADGDADADSDAADEDAR